MSYTDFVSGQLDSDPSLSNLHQYLASKEQDLKVFDHRLAVLKYFRGRMVPVVEYLQDIAALEIELNNEPKSKNEADSPQTEEPTSRRIAADDLLGRLILVEDPPPRVIDALGSHLDIDPLFFSSHIHTPWVNQEELDIHMSTLPSRLKPKEFINIHHQRTWAYQGQEKVPKKLLRVTNVSRKIITLPPLGDKRVALAQHCISVYKAKDTKDGWLGIILVDAPITERYKTMDKSQDLAISFKPFGGGFGDFLGPRAFPTFREKEPGPRRDSLFDSLIYYYKREGEPSRDLSNPSVLTLAEHALRIAASEWLIYAQVMGYKIKQYEYSPNLVQKLPIQLEKVNSDLRELQSWRRRALSSGNKIGAIARFLQFHTNIGEESELCFSLREDYDYAAQNIQKCGQLLEGMLPVLTSFIQIIDSRRSMAETANISRLTVLALIFVPLTFVSSLFSMNSEYGPSGSRFWQYFAVAIPITVMVLSVALPSQVFVGFCHFCRARFRAALARQERVRG